ncbi:MAG TPA: hypothetical protein VLZ44_08340 [Treponemataceae bacterium]|jgi:hypothetical protein|nr:hypothetical protein [Treponema sp.]HQC27470.1 hypothetical protein [Treponemataceae bacterium]HUH45163.1 hypothetical protein [Treponemataceae bacterium]
MSETDAWIEETYKDVFDEEIRGLERRCAHDPSCSIADLQGILDALYISEGNDQEGRGQRGDAIMAARIAAYEQFIGEMKKNKP